MDGVDAPQGELGVRDIIEHARTVEDRLRTRSRPPTSRRAGTGAPRRVERPAQVDAFEHVDEPARAVGHLLPAQPPGQRVLFIEVLHHVEERLVGVEDVVVDLCGGAQPIRPFSKPLTSWPKKRTFGPKWKSP